MNISRINTFSQNNIVNRNQLNLPEEKPAYLLKDVPKEKSSNDVSFKGLGDIIGEYFGKYYAKTLMDARWTRNLSESLGKVKGNMTEHMATAGSMITSSVYMARTLNNKDLDNDKKKTLAINQFLCFLIPTICAYWVNHKLKDINKAIERKYSGIQSQKLALGEINAEKAKEILKKKSDRLKGFNTLATLATFTLIYRYITPVVITPVANLIGEKLNNKAKKAEAQKQQNKLAVA